MNLVESNVWNNNRMSDNKYGAQRSNVQCLSD